jgi:2'-5' RNA ligase
VIRLFAAVAVPPDIGESLVRRQGGIEGARWRPPEALHITLRYFGDLREDVARDLDLALLNLGGPVFDLTLEGAGSFGEGADLHSIWAGVTDNPALRRLAKAAELAARTVGLPPETRVYKPHVTLAYLRRASGLEVAHWIQANNLLRSPPFPVSSFGLYSSWRTDEGSRYRLEASYPLAGHRPQ